MLITPGIRGPESPHTFTPTKGLVQASCHGELHEDVSANNVQPAHLEFHWGKVGVVERPCDPEHPSWMRSRRAPPNQFLADQEESGAFGTGSWTDTITPEWVLKSNLRLLYGNHQEISELRNFRRCGAPEQRSRLTY